MMMNGPISCLLVDDERNGREVLRKLLLPYSESMTIIGEAANTEEAFEIINRLKPQLVFLDIQMPGGDAFSLLKRFEAIDFEIVFVTSYDHYAISAIRFNAIDYLLKPIDTTELDQAVKKVVERIGKNLVNREPIDTLVYNLKNAVKRMAVHVGDKVKMVHTNEIIYIEGDGRYSDIYTVDGSKYVTPRNLKEFEEFFGEASTLLRISKSLLVNTKEIVEYSKGDPFVITLSSGCTFEVARRKKADVLDRLKK